jgi:succinylarginine dihydrolase
MPRQAHEVHFDGIVGQTHHYGGLSYGNIPSELYRAQPSNPKEAALQGLKKMKLLADLGVKQAVLPPQERPHLPSLRVLGFAGSAAQQLRSALKKAPELLSAVSSSSSMWAANAATVSPSSDSQDGRVHFTPANLSAHFHRSIEAHTTARVLKQIFSHPDYFVHHACLPRGCFFTDEGAANHSRLCRAHADPGLQIFVYGRHAVQSRGNMPKRYPARQAYEASAAVARLHQLEGQRVLFVQQHPAAIDAGAFHNDVVATACERFFFFHEFAYLNQAAFVAELQRKAAQLPGCEIDCLEVKESQISLKAAVSSYLFNAQLLSHGMQLIAPIECQENARVKEYIETVLPKHGIQQVHYVDLRQSMQNGGGPACLRLRVVLTQTELEAALPAVFLTEALYQQLTAWVQKHYRDRLRLEDLADPQLLSEVRTALDELTKILQLGNIYEFQSALQ